jgi:hypothetical protein
VIDETRIEGALREGPPFRTHYVPGSLTTGQAALRPAPLRASLVLLAVVVTLALVVGGEALIGSGVIKLPVLTDTYSAAPGPTQAWTATSAMVTPRSDGHTVTSLADGTVLVAGGADGDWHILAAAEVLDPATLTWTSTGDMTQARWNYTATLLPDGRVLVAGGGAVHGNGYTLASAELYDPATGSWTATGEMTQTRQGHVATLLSDGRVLVAGGHIGEGGNFLGSAELYDPVTGIWVSTGDMTQTRSGGSATLLPDGRVLVAGGVDKPYPGCCVPQSSAELYDPRTGAWAATGSMIEPGGGSASVLPDGRVLVLGEINAGTGDGRSSAQLYDPGTGSWTITRNIIELQEGFTASLLPDGRVLVAGGSHITSGEFTHPKGIGLAAAGLYDPRTEAWAFTRSMKAPRAGHVAVVLADGRVLAVGGWAVWSVLDDGSSVLSDPAAEIFDPDGGG